MKSISAPPKSNIPAPLEAATALRSAGSLLEALAVLTSQTESDLRQRTVRAEIEFELGRYADAALSYFPLAISEPYNANVHYNLGLCLQRSSRWEAAAEAFQRVLFLDPERADAKLGLGDCLLHLKRAEEALRNFDPGLPGANRERGLFGKAVALQLLGRFDDARKVYETLLSSDRHSEEVLANLIALSVEANDLDRVRDHSQRLLKLRPQSTVAMQGLASVALESGDNQAAVSYCFRILDLTPDSLEAWHNLRIAMDPSVPAVAMHSGRK